MAWTGTFGHEGAGGRSPFDRIAALDRSLVSSSARENVSRVGGDIDPAEVVDWIHDGLMQSPGHRDNILASDVSHLAVGVVALGDRFVTTQVFVGQVASLDPPLSVRLVDPGGVLASVSLPDAWTFVGYAVAYPGGEMARIGDEAPLASGDGQLMVLARKTDPTNPPAHLFDHLLRPRHHGTRPAPIPLTPPQIQQPFAEGCHRCVLRQCLTWGEGRSPTSCRSGRGSG